MTKSLQEALEGLVPHLGEGCQIFISFQGNYHKFRVVSGKVCHTETHSNSHVESGRGALDQALRLVC